MTLRVLHLVGSPTSDFFCDLSRLYAADCLDATADPARYEFHVAYVTPDRRWRFPTDLSPAAIEAAVPLPAGQALCHVASLGLDVVVPQMFCPPGMTAYRALFDVLGVPVVDNPPEAMALGAHKARARAVVAAAGVAVPDGEVLRRGGRPTLVPPVVVKPVDGDNSMGVSLVRDPAEYEDAIACALAESEVALVESYVELGREVRCGVLERDGELVCLPLEEYAVDPATKPIRGRDDKIRSTAEGGLGLVAKDANHAWIVDVDDPVTARVWEVARRCHDALGCRGYSLLDFRVDPDEQPWFLEAGLYCSFARTSVLAVMANAGGISLPELFATLVGGAAVGTRPGGS